MHFIWSIKLHFVLLKRYGTLILNTGVVVFLLAATNPSAYKSLELSRFINYPLAVLLPVNFMFTAMVSNLFCGGKAERVNYLLSGAPKIERVIIAKSISLMIYFVILSCFFIGIGHQIVHPSSADYNQAIWYQLCTLPLLMVIGTFSSVYLMKNTFIGIPEMMVVVFCFIAAHIPYVLAVRWLEYTWVSVLIFISVSVFWYFIQVPKAAAGLIKKNYNLIAQ